jgi:hypothetical protein
MDPKTILQGRNPYGNLGGPDWMQRLVSGNSQGMPDWLRSQVQTVDTEGGSRNVLGSASDQQLYDKSGQPVQQLGNEGSWYGDGDGSVLDWSKVRYDPDLGLVTSPDNTKHVKAKSTQNFQTIGQLLALAAAGGAVAGVLPAGEAAAAGAGAAGGAGAGAGAAAGGASALPITNTGLGALFQGAPGLAPGVGGSEAAWLAGAGGGAGAGAGGGSGLANLGTQSPAPVTDLSTNAAANGASRGVLGSGLSGSQLANGARLVGGLASLGAAGAGAGSSNSSGGLATDPNSIIDQMAQANRVNQNTPFGSRAWSKDPQTGQWTVNDTLSAPEQANFTNVQGLNASTTDMARQRLAQMLATPQQTFGNSFTVNGRKIGG